MPTREISIGQLASRTGCKVQTIRYYEQIGLMPESLRTEGNQRRYGPDHVARLAFVRHSRELGFSLEAIRELLSLADAPERPCAGADAIARRQLGEEIQVYHGAVGEMPFDQEVYEGIFGYALIHLLNAEERKKLIRDCYHQLAPGGCMVFVTLSKGDARYGQGVKVAKDSFLTQHGVTLFFYDLESIEAEFGSYGLSEVVEINEPREFTEGMPRQRFWWIECLKGVE